MATKHCTLNFPEQHRIFGITMMLQWQNHLGMYCFPVPVATSFQNTTLDNGKFMQTKN
jgi:hypothetical protein